MHLLLEATLKAARAIATTTSALRAGRFVRHVGHAAASSPTANGYRQALYGTRGCPLAGPLTRVHAVVVGEIPADHVGIGGRAFSCLALGTVSDVGRVLAVVDADFAVPALAGAVTFVERFGPMTTGTDAWGPMMSVVCR
jgi:hypothetical protein